MKLTIQLPILTQVTLNDQVSHLYNHSDTILRIFISTSIWIFNVPLLILNFRLKILRNNIRNSLTRLQINAHSNFTVTFQFIYNYQIVAVHYQFSNSKLKILLLFLLICPIYFQQLICHQIVDTSPCINNITKSIHRFDESQRSILSFEGNWIDWAWFVVHLIAHPCD